MITITLFKELDYKSTKTKAKNVLKSVSNLVLILSSSYESKVTQTFSLELKTFGNSNFNALDEHLARQDEAEEELSTIYKAFNALSVNDRKILYLKYLDQHKKPDFMIMTELGYSESQFYNLLDLAIIKFAHAYKFGELLEYEK
ncbi:ArpU family phage packaging/lysis transcriptional regulator [Holzapfeliella sp. He02]|uniref:ArpU family phage packaging/lysis transcriptional regulator n=1 Tax=Holzapfeliella saturejae TaxID=3082953 RepID=A0ABU8SI32_9LACO